MLIGPASTAEQRSEFAFRIQQDPRNYIAQPTLCLSRVPTLAGERFEGRRGPASLYSLWERRYLGASRRADPRGVGERITGGEFFPGGGSKDTWVMARNEEEAVEAETTL